MKEKPLSEQIVVYFFFDTNGVEQEFKTLDRDVAKHHANLNGFAVIARTYEYKNSAVVRKVRGGIV